MLEIRNVKVYDLKESVIACRNAMRLEMPEYTDEEFEKSLVRAKKLSLAGSPHNNYLCGIRVAYDIKYPQYISPEMQRYHFNDIVTSSSKMHRLVKMDIDESCNKYVTKAVKDYLKGYIMEYNIVPSYENWMKVISNCPMGLELFMRCDTNYLQLRNIYHQRKAHKLKEDWGAFCKFVEELPYAKELIIGE